jgi:hypothetical protein
MSFHLSGYFDGSVELVYYSVEHARTNAGATCCCFGLMEFDGSSGMMKKRE